jgi:acetyl esterase/lipase
MWPVKPGVLLFIHGGVWIVGNFQNHQCLMLDLVVGSGQIVLLNRAPESEAEAAIQQVTLSRPKPGQQRAGA